VISAHEAGMSVRREDGRWAWTRAAANAKGDIAFQNWPAWGEAPVPEASRQPPAASGQAGVSFVFLAQGEAVMEITVPVQGYVDDVLTEARGAPVVRFFSDLSVAGEPDPHNAAAATQATHPPAERPASCPRSSSAS
jgi:hypothetical protein